MPGGAQQHDYPPVNNASTRRKPTFEPHETPTLQPQYSEGDDAPFRMYAYDRERTWSLYFLARQQFTVSKIAEYTMERRDRLELIDILLESGADPNEIYEGYTIWQYFVHSLHTRLPPEKGNVMTLDYRNALKQRVKALMERGVDLDVCCIKESEVWERLYRVEGPEGHSPEELNKAVASLWIAFAKHAGNNDGEDGDAKSLNSSDSASTVSSTSQINSSGPPSRNTIRQSDNYPTGTGDGDNIVESDDDERDETQTEASLQAKPEGNVEEDPLFEEHHSLTTIFKEWFETKDDLHGADDILELMGRLKATKATTQNVDGGSSIEAKLRGSTTW